MDAPGAIAILACYCLTRIDYLSANHGLPEIVGVVITVGVHLWRRNAVLEHPHRHHRLPRTHQSPAALTAAPVVRSQQQAAQRPNGKFGENLQQKKAGCHLGTIPALA